MWFSVNLSQDLPGVTIVTGPPGAGKSSLRQLLRIGEDYVVDIDAFVMEMAKLNAMPFSEYLEKYGDRVRQYNRRAILEATTRREPRVIETVIGRRGGIFDFMLEQGISPVNIIFVDADPETCIQRVGMRLFEGGIFLPKQQVEQMLMQAREAFAEKVESGEFKDYACVVDNTKHPQIALEIFEGKIVYRASKLSKWLKDLADRLEPHPVYIMQNLGDHPKIMEPCRVLRNDLQSLNSQRFINSPHWIFLLDDRLLVSRFRSLINLDQLFEKYEEETKGKGHVFPALPSLKKLAIPRELPEKEIVESIFNRLQRRQSFLVTNKFYELVERHPELLEEARKNGFQTAALFVMSDEIIQAYERENIGSTRMRKMMNFLKLFDYGYIYGGSYRAEPIMRIHRGIPYYIKEGHPLQVFFERPDHSHVPIVDEVVSVLNDAIKSQNYRISKFDRYPSRDYDSQTGRFEIDYSNEQEDRGR